MVVVDWGGGGAGGGGGREEEEEVTEEKEKKEKISFSRILPHEKSELFEQPVPYRDTR